MNISQLRETVTELLSASPNLIGTYTLPNNSTLPAVYVVGRQSVPKEWKVKGMEVTMREFPERIPAPMLGKVEVRQVWEVILVQYTSSSGTMNEAMERMVRRFPDATPRYFPGDDIAYERCRFLIPDTVLKTLYPA
jgi:hypothetical protein